MPDRRFTYKVDVDTSSARRAGATLRRELEGQLRNIPVGGSGSTGGARGGTVVPGAPAGSSAGGIGLGRFATIGGALYLGKQAAAAIRTAEAFGQLGAQNVRLTDSFYQLAEGANLSGEAIVNKLGTALNNTVDDVSLMAETNLLLTASQQGVISITEDQIAQLGRFALIRSRQLTAQGKAMTAQEAYARIIRGVVKRETEILDELGLSTKLLAATLGVSTKEINNSVDSLLESILAVAAVEIPKYGDEFKSQADLMERADALTKNSANRIAEHLAGLTLAYKEAKAAAIEWAESQVAAAVGDSAVTRASRAAEQKFIESILSGTIQRGFVVESGFIESQNSLVEASRVAAQYISDQAENATEASQKIAILTREAERLADVYFQIRRGEVQGILDPDEVTSLLNRWQSLVFMLDSGSITVDVLTGAVNQLEDAFDEASSAANVLNMALAAIGVTGALGISTAADRAAGMKEQIRALYWEAVRVNEIKDQIGLAQGSMFSRAMTQADTAGKIDLLTKALEDNTLSFEERLRKQEQLTTYQVRLGEEQKAALEKNTSALERARGAFESAIRQVPGLFGLSEVTSEQLRQARMGIPQNFADDYIRRLTDEVVNGVDWAGVDIADAARRAGLNPAGNPAVLLEQVRQAWESGAFFADPANLELINQDAIANFLEQQRRQQLGQKNITDFLAGQGFAGLFGEEGFADLGTPIAQQLATALPQAISDSNVGQNSIQAIQNDILNPDILGPRTTAIGMGIAAGIFAGFGDGLDEYAWADAIMNRVYEDLAERNARGTGPY